jgi:hypothetical protein
MAHKELSAALQTSLCITTPGALLSPAIESYMHASIGYVDMFDCHFDDAIRHHEHDLRLMSDKNDSMGQLRAHSNLGMTYLASGDAQHALEHFRSHAVCVVCVNVYMSDDLEARQHL